MTGTPGVGAPPPPPGHHGPPPSPLFRALDTNGAGVISAEEIANAPTTLKTLAGASGQITRDSLRPPRREGDEQKQGDEARRPHHRPPPDTQGDENPAPRPPRQPEDRPQRPPPPDGEHGSRKQDNTPASGAPPADAPPDGLAGRHHGPPHGDGLFNALDADGDGTVSAEEIAAAATTLKKADTNGDGVIDRRDFRPPPPPPAPAD